MNQKKFLIFGYICVLLFSQMLINTNAVNEVLAEADREYIVPIRQNDKISHSNYTYPFYNPFNATIPKEHNIELYQNISDSRIFSTGFLSGMVEQGALIYSNYSIAQSEFNATFIDNYRSFYLNSYKYYQFFTTLPTLYQNEFDFYLQICNLTASGNIFQFRNTTGNEVATLVVDVSLNSYQFIFDGISDSFIADLPTNSIRLTKSGSSIDFYIDSVLVHTYTITTSYYRFNELFIGNCSTALTILDNSAIFNSSYCYLDSKILSTPILFPNLVDYSEFFEGFYRKSVIYQDSVALEGTTFQLKSDKITYLNTNFTFEARFSYINNLTIHFRYNQTNNESFSPFYFRNQFPSVTLNSSTSFNILKIKNYTFSVYNNYDLVTEVNFSKFVRFRYNSSELLFQTNITSYLFGWHSNFEFYSDSRDNVSTTPFVDFCTLNSQFIPRVEEYLTPILGFLDNELVSFQNQSRYPTINNQTSRMLIADGILSDSMVYMHYREDLYVCSEGTSGSFIINFDGQTLRNDYIRIRYSNFNELYQSDVYVYNYTEGVGRNYITETSFPFQHLMYYNATNESLEVLSMNQTIRIHINESIPIRITQKASATIFNQHPSSINASIPEFSRYMFVFSQTEIYDAPQLNSSSEILFSTLISTESSIEVQNATIFASNTLGTLFKAAMGVVTWAVNTGKQILGVGSNTDEEVPEGAGSGKGTKKDNEEKNLFNLDNAFSFDFSGLFGGNFIEAIGSIITQAQTILLDIASNIARATLEGIERLLQSALSFLKNLQLELVKPQQELTITYASQLYMDSKGSTSITVNVKNIWSLGFIARIQSILDLGLAVLIPIVIFMLIPFGVWKATKNPKITYASTIMSGVLFTISRLIDYGIGIILVGIATVMFVAKNRKEQGGL